MFNWIAGIIVLLIFVAFFWPQAPIPHPNDRFAKPATDQVSNLSNENVRDNTFTKPGDTNRAQAFRDAEVFDQNIRQLLQQAQDLFEQKKFTIPESHNALKIYYDVLTLSPNNSTAKQGIENILDELLLIGKNALNANQLATANHTLKKLQSIDNNSSQAFLLSSDIAIWHEDKKRSDKLSQANQAFAEGKYIAPATKNALYYYEQILADEPKNKQALNGIQKIIKLYANRTENALSNGQISEATTSLEILNEIDPKFPLIQSFRNRLAQAKAISSAINE